MTLMLMKAFTGLRSALLRNYMAQFRHQCRQPWRDAGLTAVCGDRDAADASACVTDVARRPYIDSETSSIQVTLYSLKIFAPRARARRPSTVGVQLDLADSGHRKFGGLFAH